MDNRHELERLQTEVLKIGTSAHEQFGAFSQQQLNWKPDPNRWSVAQCFDHLIVSNSAYFPVVESIVNGQQKTSVLHRLPILPKLWAKLLIKSLDPKTTRKLKATAAFQPSSSGLPSSIIDDFVAHQKKLVESMEATSDLNPDRIIISSPVAKVVTYSLMDGFRILVVHEQRHFQQAQRVTEETAFPR